MNESERKEKGERGRIVEIAEMIVPVPRKAAGGKEREINRLREPWNGEKKSKLGSLP